MTHHKTDISMGIQSRGPSTLTAYGLVYRLTKELSHAEISSIQMKHIHGVHGYVLVRYCCMPLLMPTYHFNSFFGITEIYPPHEDQFLFSFFLSFYAVCSDVSPLMRSKCLYSGHITKRGITRKSVAKETDCRSQHRNGKGPFS